MKMLAIDIGASGGRAFTGEFQRGGLVVSEVRRFPNSIVEVHGHKHWDILRLFGEVKECLRSAADADSVGIDTWAVDYGYVDRDGDIMGLPFAYRDSRTQNSIPMVHERIPRERLFEVTGIQFLPFNTIYQVADDLASRPWIVENADRLLMIPELLGYLLTGAKIAEYTNAGTTAMLDVHARAWSLDLLQKVGFPPEKLAEIAQPGRLKARLSRTVADETGSDAEFVFVACHDTASAVAAIPAYGQNWAFISSGTWSLVGMELAEPVITDEARDANFTNEGGVDGKIRFLTNVTGLWLLDELRRAWARDGQAVEFDDILEEAGKAPRFRSIVNPDDRSFVAPDDMRVAIREFCRRTGQTIPNDVGPFSRCVFESLALAYRRRIRRLIDITGRPIERIHVVGGGSRNRLLCKMTADACGIPVIAGPSEATAIGNLLVQGIAAGAVEGIAEGRRILRNSFTPVEYEPADTELWAMASENFDTMCD